MTTDVTVYPISCPIESFQTMAYYIDAPEPVLIDTGISSSPSECIGPTLAKHGLKMSALRWLLLTHGHLDHLGGAHTLWEGTQRRSQVAIHEKDAGLMRDRYAYLLDHAEIRNTYLGGRGAERAEAIVTHMVSGNLEPTRILIGGEELDVGGGVTLRVLNTPGHSGGSVTYWLDGVDYAFVGDAVQLAGGIVSHFPSYEDPRAYRASLEALQERRPQKLFMGHSFTHPSGDVFTPEVNRADVMEVLRASLEMEERITDAATRHLTGQQSTEREEEDGPYGMFAAIAKELDYTTDPTRFPMPFFITMNGYRNMLRGQTGASSVVAE